MKKTARRASTQVFTEILDIVDNVVVVGGGNACSIIEVSATNFTLQSADEQWAKISSYASLLNSLSFPIQILIRSKRVDISNYLKSLDYQASSNPNKVLSDHITKYRNFISELIKQNTVLDKKFYIVLSYSYLEKGAIGAAKSKTNKDDFVPSAKLILKSKLESLISEIGRIGLKARILDRKELISLFYDVYNNGSVESSKITEGSLRPALEK